ncbi:response regulator [Halorubrum xinjiangense]|uniref:response regulator n=1 Tax=Halorubrum xinjiangense TaxID=261291 RepID=UPI00122D695E|nr:response regulator [Halorubrum xinjiangense]
MAHTPTVLIVEDEKELADLYVNWLNDEYNTRTAYSGEDALTIADSDIDTVLMDRRMPGPSGDEISRKLREHGHNYPIAMISAVIPDLEIANVPVDIYVTKPAPQDQLQAVVELLLTLREYDKQQRRAFALAQKKAILDDATTFNSRKTSTAYSELTTELNELSGELQQIVSKIDTDAQPIKFSESLEIS